MIKNIFILQYKINHQFNQNIFNRLNYYNIHSLTLSLQAITLTYQK